MGDAVATLERVTPSEPPEESQALPPPARSWARALCRRIIRSLGSAAEWLFGLASLVVILSTLAAWPVVQLLSLGYLLESSARVARSGRLRDGLVGVRRAARIGGMALGIWLALLPAWLVESLARSAELIDPGSRIARNWRAALVIVTVLTFFHIAVAVSRGARLRHFLWPLGHPFWLFRRLRAGGLYAQTRNAVWSYVAALRLPHYFRLGLVGFLGTLAWLAVPASLIAAGGRQPLLGVLGALVLALIVPYLPFLQVHYAVEGRLVALFSRARSASVFDGPRGRSRLLLLFCWWRRRSRSTCSRSKWFRADAAWLPSLVFVVFLAPARLLLGWAYARSGRREEPRHWLLRWMGRLAIIPAALLYVLVVFLAQYTSWEGVTSLYDQHAFLLPVPFLNM